MATFAIITHTRDDFMSLQCHEHRIRVRRSDLVARLLSHVAHNNGNCNAVHREVHMHGIVNTTTKYHRHEHTHEATPCRRYKHRVSHTASPHLSTACGAVRRPPRSAPSQFQKR